MCTILLLTGAGGGCRGGGAGGSRRCRRGGGGGGRVGIPRCEPQELPADIAGQPLILAELQGRLADSLRVTTFEQTPDTAARTAKTDSVPQK